MEGILKFWGLRWEHLWVKAEHYSHYYFKLIRTDTALDLSQKAQKQSHTTTLKKSFIFLEASRSLPYTTILRTTKFWVGGGVRFVRDLGSTWLWSVLFLVLNSGIIPGGACQELCIVPEVEPRLATCKINALPSVQAIQPIIIHDANLLASVSSTEKWV